MAKTKSRPKSGLRTCRPTRCTEDARDRRPTGTTAKSAKTGAKASDGPEVEEERVGVLGLEVLLGQHLQRVGRDVEHAAERPAAEPGQAMVARFGPIRFCIIALHFRSASVRSVAMIMTNTEEQDEEVAEPQAQSAEPTRRRAA